MRPFLSLGSFSIVRLLLTLLLSEDLLQPAAEAGDVVEDEDAEDLQVKLITLFLNV
jgi:hypothetical protein